MQSFSSPPGEEVAWLRTTSSPHKEEVGLAQNHRLGLNVAQRSAAAVTPANCCSAALICSRLFTHKLDSCRRFLPSCQSALPFLSRPVGTQTSSSRAALCEPCGTNPALSLSSFPRLYFRHLLITPGSLFMLSSVNEERSARKAQLMWPAVSRRCEEELKSLLLQLLAASAAVQLETEWRFNLRPNIWSCQVKRVQLQLH